VATPLVSSGERHFRYLLPFYGSDGKPYLLDGHKDLTGAGAWHEMSTLYTVVHTGHGIGGPVVPGVYFRTKADFYTGASGASGPNGKVRKETLVITALGGDMFRVEDIDSKNGAAETRMTQTSKRPLSSE